MDGLLPTVALMAPSFWVAWIELIYSGEIFLGAQEPSSFQIIVNYAWSTTALSVVLIILGAFPKKSEELLTRDWFLLGCGVGASITTWLTLAWGAPIIVILTGMFTAPLAMRFALLFSQVNPKAAMFTIVIAQIMASFIYGYVLSLQRPWGVVIMILLPFIGAFCSLLHDDHLNCETPATPSSLSRNFLRFVLAIFLFSVAINIVRGFYPSTIEMDTFAEARGNSSVLFFFVKMAVAFGVLWLPTRVNLGHLCYYAFVCLAFMTLSLPLFGLGSSSTLELFGCINALLNVVIWTLLAGIAYKSGRSMVRLFDWAWGPFSLGSVLGWLGGYILVECGVDASSLVVIELFILGVMLISCVFVVTWPVIDKLFDPLDNNADESIVDRSMGEKEAFGAAHTDNTDAVQESPKHITLTGNIPTSFAAPIITHQIGAQAARVLAQAPIEPSGDQAPFSQQGRWKRSVAAMASDKALSTRETEVFRLLLKGYNKQRVAEELFIGYNTVRSHVRNIYTKCDAHNQQELIDQFETDYLKNSSTEQ